MPSKSLRNVAVRRRLCKNLNSNERHFLLTIYRSQNTRSNSIQHVVQFEDASIVEVTFRRDQIQRSTIQDTCLVNKTFSTVESLNIRAVISTAKAQIDCLSYGFQWVSIDQIEKHEQMDVQINFGQRSRPCARCLRTRCWLLFTGGWCRWTGAFVHFHVHRLRKTKQINGDFRLLKSITWATDCANPRRISRSLDKEP